MCIHVCKHVLINICLDCSVDTDSDIVGFPGGAVIKNLSTNAGEGRDAGLTPGSESSPGVENGNPL